MAIFSAVPPPSDTPSQGATSQALPHHGHSASGTIDIEAWTVSALESLSVSPIARGTGTPLSIPLDEHGNPRSANATAAGITGERRVTIALDGDAAAVTPPRRPPSRRDSMRRREALLKGKEGSRQRRRWDMARLCDVPNVEPPLPSDWEVHPTHVVRHIPYHIAQYWDKGLQQQVEEKKAAVALQRKKRAGDAGKVPRDLRDKVRHKPGLKGWVRVLEEPVRQFLVERGVGEERREDDDDSLDSEDDEIVFVGRNGSMRDGGKRDGWKRAHREVHEKPVDAGIVFDSLEDDESGAFKRWLTHSISDYYGLDSRSVTMGNPSRRVVYIGIKDADIRKPQVRPELPRPLWELF